MPSLAKLHEQGQILSGVDVLRLFSLVAWVKLVL